MFQHVRTAIGSLLLVWASMGAAQAAVVTFSDRTVWNAATAGVSNIDFEGLAEPGSFVVANGATIGGVTFTGSGNLFVVDPAYSPEFYDWGSGAVMLGDLNSTITATFAGVTSLGLDLMSILDYGATLTLGLSTGDSVAVATANYPDRTFFGVTSDLPITMITISGSGGYPEIDNFSFGRAGVAAVPEPSSILLVGLAAAALRLASRRKSA